MKGVWELHKMNNSHNPLDIRECSRSSYEVSGLGWDSGEVLSCKHKDLSSDPQHPGHSWAHWHVCSPSTGQMETGSLLASQPSWVSEPQVQ